jgi:HEAT repeat protein
VDGEDVQAAKIATANAAARKILATLLGQIGPDAKEALPMLSLLLEDEDEKVRAAAREAIRKISEASGGT